MRRALLLLLALLVALLLAWQMGALGSSTPPASGATGACDPTLSILSSDYLAVPTGAPATLTATCKSLGGPVAGRTIVLTQKGGNSTISPISGVTNGQGVVQFKVSSASVAGPITYTAVDNASGTAFDQIVQVRFVSGALGANIADLPIETVGLFGVAGIGAIFLVLLQVYRRRRAPAKARVPHAG